MTIQCGETIPHVIIKMPTAEGVATISSTDLLKGKRTVIVGVPGAFTPVCSSVHIAGFLANYDDIRQKGVDQIVCLAVNDAFVLKAWSASFHNKDAILMVADGNGELTAAMGLTLDGRDFGLGFRSQRYSMIVQNGIVEKLMIEDSAGACAISSADTLMQNL